MCNGIEKLKSLGRDSLISLAFEILRDKKPELDIRPDDFEITIWANRKELAVKFRRLIRYLLAGVYYEYDLSINLISGEICPFDNLLYSGNFFVPTKEQNAAIEYVKEVIHLPYPGMNNEIFEDEEYYRVDITSETAFIHHRINKATGEQLEPLSGTYMVMPADLLPPEIEEDPLEELL